MTKQLAKKDKNELSNEVTRPRGFEEDMDQSDIQIPRAKKLEALSPEVVADDSTLKPGQIINSLTGEVLPDEFTPIFWFKNWIRFNPRDKNAPGFVSDFGPGDIIYRTSDPKDERLKEDAVWRGDTPPLATKFLNFFSVFKGVDMPIVVSFCNTSFKSGKNLLTISKFTNKDMWLNTYRLTTEKKSNDKGNFFVLKAQLVGATDDETIAKCEAFYTSFRGKDIQVHQEEENTEQVPF